MMASSIIVRELNHLLDKEVIVEFKDGKKLKGILKAVDPGSLNLVLGDIVIGRDEYSRVVFSGDQVKAIYLRAIEFDLMELRRRLEKVFPKMVHYRADERVLVVMGKFKVSEEGVEGESGPILDRIKKVYEEYLKELRGQE